MNKEDENNNNDKKIKIMGSKVASLEIKKSEINQSISKNTSRNASA